MKRFSREKRFLKPAPEDLNSLPGFPCGQPKGGIVKHLFVAAAFAVIITFISVMAEGQEPETRIPRQYEDSSIEVGFSQDGEPEPHLFAVAKDGKVALFELSEQPRTADLKPAHEMSRPPTDDPGREMPQNLYLHRMRQAIEQEHYFTARQARRQGRCKDLYVLRVKQGSRFRERRGCSGQTNDPFAAFAQVVFRDAFLTYRPQAQGQRMPASVSDPR